MPVSCRGTADSEASLQEVTRVSVYLTQREAADLLRISARTLERYRLTGEGPAYVKVGRKVVYRPADIDAWALKNTYSSTSQMEASRG